jgi:hypothetical protein
MHKLKIIHVFIYSGVLVLGMLSFVFSTKAKESALEKRRLAQKPTVTLNGILDGSWMQQYQKFMDDHFPWRSTFVNIAFQLNEFKGIKNPNNVRLITKTKEKKIDEKKIDLNKAARDVDYLINAESASSHGLLIIAGRAFQVFGGNRSSVKSYVDVVNEYRKILPDNVRVFNCVVPTGSSFVFVKEYDYLREKEFKNIDDAYAQSSPDVITVPAKEALVAHQDEYIYFASDHHWTGRGAYYAYTAFCQAAGLKATPLSKMTRKVKRNFLGTLYNLTKDESIKNNADSVEYFIPPVKTDVKVFAEYAAGGNSYGVFLGGDIAHLKINTSVKNGKSVVIIKNSFGNPFSTFLINNYETVHVVDYRYFDSGLLRLIKNEGIDDVLFFHNVFSANTLSHSERQRIIKNPLSGGSSTNENKSENKKSQSDSVKKKTKEKSKNELKNEVEEADTTN